MPKKANKRGKQKKKKQPTSQSRPGIQKKRKKKKEKKLLIGLVKGGKEDSLVIDCNYSSPHYFLLKLERKNFGGAREKTLAPNQFSILSFSLTKNS